MTEEKTKKRGWVKNAAIIFLAVMLALTLFSNTIMNASLPEVAQQTVQNGTITAKIRGSGVVEANGSYDVLLKQSYKVAGVNVRVGDTVAVGDTLFTLTGEESDDLQTARDTLEEMKLQYQIDLLQAASSEDYTTDNRAIAKAQKQLDEAIAERDKNTVTQGQLDAAKKNIDAAKKNVDAAQEKVDAAQEKVDQYQQDLSGLSSGGGSSVFEIARSIENKQAELEAAKLAYETELADLETLARAEMASAGAAESELDKYIAALAMRATTDKDMVTAYNAVKGIESELRSLEGQYAAAADSDTSGQYWAVKKQLDDAKAVLKTENTALTSVKAALEDEEKTLTELEAKQDTYKKLLETIETNQASVDDLTFALEQKISEAEKDSAVEELQFEQKRREIEKQQRTVNELASSASGETVTAPQAGIIKTINVKAGATTDAATPLAVIETPDLGYVLSFSVTNEQAKKVSVGDAAEVSNAWWGSQITGTLKQIKTDPQNASTNKLLVFELSGEVESGSTLQLTIGQRSQNYDAVVPNSAVRSDSKGSFVLIVESKNVPLGTRYTARRVDVKALASDDVNTAISGGLSAWNDWVITTSSKPLEPGMHVRLADN